MFAYLASVAALLNVPNAKYLAHQTQKQGFIRCSKSQKLCHITTVPSQIWDSTDNNGKMGYYYFIAFFSLLFHRYLSLRWLYLISSLSITFYLFPLLPAQESCSRSLLRKLPPISPPHFPILTVGLASPHHLILHNLLSISPPHALVLVDLVGFGFVIEFWFGLRLWVMS